MVLEQLKALIVRYLTSMRWYTVVLALVIYALTSWLMLAMAGEDALLPLHEFIYWLVVTGSTVGYGDISPATPVGKYVVSLYVIPVGLSLFALILGRIVAWISRHWRKGIEGLKALNVSDHILVIGWNQERTLQLLSLLLNEQALTKTQRTIVLCVRADIINPKPGQIEFVKVDSFNRDDCMDMACVANAGVIVMDNPDDDMTMTTSLYVHKRNPKCHKIAYFKDENLASLLKSHCPNIECTPSVAVELLAKSAIDPGSSALHHKLLNVQSSDTQYSLTIPDIDSEISVDKLFTQLKQQYRATLIAAKQKHSGEIQVNPELTDSLRAGDTFYYIANTRINNIDWELFYV